MNADLILGEVLAMFSMQALTPLFSVTKLVNAAYYQLGPDFQWPGERHDFWEVVYVDRGEAVITAEEEEYTLKAWEMVFHCPNEWHNLRAAEGKTAGVIVIAFVCDSPGMEAFRRRIIALGPQERQCLTTIVREAERAYVYFENRAPHVRLVRREDAPLGAEQLIRANLEQLFIYACRGSAAGRAEAPRMNSNALNHHSEMVERTKGFLYAHIHEKITLARVAAEISVSPSHLKRVFREQTGQSVIAYLTDMRVRRAKQMICDHQYNFSQIAEAVGFDSVYYFSARFKKYTGMTPTDYARSVRR